MLAAPISMSASEILDPSDVPVVAVRELVLAVKILSGEGLRLPAREFTDADLRRVEQAFWQVSSRHRTRKSAVLLRLRCFCEAAKSRRMTALLEGHGADTLLHALSVAATMRLNAKRGFNPLKLARAIADALAGEGTASVTLAA
jgi:hypothetical protein